MPIERGATDILWRRMPPLVQAARFGAWLLLAAFTVWCFEVMTRDTIWAFALDAPRQAADLFSRMVPPRWGYIGELWAPLWETLNIATIGTLLAIGMALPVAFLAARNTTPSVLFLRPLALFIIVSSRSINSLI